MGAGRIAIFALGISVGPAAAQSVTPPELTAGFAAAALDHGRLVAAVSAIDQAAPGDALDALVDTAFESGASDPFGALAGLVHVAGRDIPTGLSAARDAERRAHRDAVRAALSGREGEQRAALGSIVARLLERTAEPTDAESAAPGATRVLPTVRASAVRTAGALELYALAPTVAAWLDAANDPETSVAARDALHDLYGRWFNGRASFQALWPRLEGKREADLFLDELEEREAESSGRLLSLVVASPEDNLAEAFAEPNPEFRASVARAVGAAVGDGTLGPDRAWTLLRERLEREPANVAASALLNSLLELVQGAAGDDPRVEELRACLRRVADRELPGLDSLVLRAVPRVPWRRSDGAPIRLEADLAFASTLLDRAGAGLRPIDADALVLGLNAYGTLARRIEDPARRRAVIGTTPNTLRALVEGAPGASPRVRAAAADALSAVLSAQDLDVLLELVDDLDESGVRFKLLGVLADAAPLVEDPADLLRVTRTVLGAAEGRDAAVRARAIELLADERLAASRAAARAAGPEFDRRVLALVRQPLGEAEWIALLDVVAGSRNPQLADELMRADTLRPLANGPPQVLDALTSTVRSLAADQHEKLWMAATFLAFDIPGDPNNELSRPRRVAAALGLVLSLPESALSEFSPGRHAQVVGWFLELRAPGIDKSDVALGLDADARRRLSAVHAAAVAADQPDSAGPKVVAALLALDGLPEAPTAEQSSAVILALDAAIDASRTAGDSQGSIQLVLERARLASAASRPGVAERDWFQVFEQQPALLAGRDLRALADLATAAGRHARAVVVLDLLFDRDDWSSRPAEGRLADLRTLVAATLAANDPAILDRARRRLAGVPPAGTNGEAAATPPEGAAWPGLLEAGAEVHTELLTLAAALAGPTPPEGGEEGGQ